MLLGWDHMLFAIAVVLLARQSKRASTFLRVDAPERAPGVLGRMAGEERRESWLAAERATARLSTSSLLAVAVLRQVRAARRLQRRGT